ncbi:E3 ubiquitin-protein ligase [Aureococcus anophagefferens]|uniref:E3 ubiquitin-protein ligase n=1 Tax=Aureococcus anophagefferens TaxID=44056 RepID=A0ABR1G0L5_AURAN
MGAKRARHVELRLAGRDMPCRFDENGCDFSGTKAERRAHDDVCLHKKYRCPFAEGCPALLKVEAMRDHGVEAHRLRVTDRAPRERFVDHLVEMAEPRDRLNRMRKWKLLYAIDGDIYFLRVRRRKDPGSKRERNFQLQRLLSRPFSTRKDPDLREMQMALSAYRIFRKDGDDGARPPLRVKVAIALEHRQAIAFTLNPEDALTTRKPRTPIPLDRVMDLPMHTAVQFPASMCDLTVGDLPGEPLKVDLTVEFHP